MKPLNKSALRRTTTDILNLRSNRRRAALDCLKPLIPHAQDVAGLFTEAEMRVLIATHDRIAWSELTTIDPTFQSSPNDDPDRLMYGTSLYSGALLGQLCRLVYVGMDDWFPRPHSDAADRLMDKLRVLSPEESLALHAMIEAAATIPCGTISYANWWYPDQMVRILQAPETDDGRET